TPTRRSAGEPARASARADGEEDFLAERVLELLEVQRGLAFVAQHFQHRRAALFGDLDAAVFDVHDVHLQRFDLKVPVVAAIWTSQVHVGSSFAIDSMRWGWPAQRKSAEKWPIIAKSGRIC